MPVDAQIMFSNPTTWVLTHKWFTSSYMLIFSHPFSTWDEKCPISPDTQQGEELNQQPSWRQPWGVHIISLLHSGPAVPMALAVPPGEDQGWPRTVRAGRRRSNPRRRRTIYCTWQGGEWPRGQEAGHWMWKTEISRPQRMLMGGVLRGYAGVPLGSAARCVVWDAPGISPIEDANYRERDDVEASPGRPSTRLMQPRPTKYALFFLLNIYVFTEWRPYFYL